jgi:hypothetical protein
MASIEACVRRLANDFEMAGRILSCHTREIKNDSWKQSTLDEPEEEATCEQTGVIVHLRLKRRYKTPQDADCGKKNARPDPVQDQVGR